MTTIGVAIAVPEPWGSRLQDYRASLGDKSAHGIPTHITLMPPFEVEPDHQERVHAHLEDAARHHRPFEVHLRGTATFRPVSPVVFITLARGISQCEQLAFSVRRGPLRTELAFPYHPHVTVAHDLDDDLLDRAFDELGDFECSFQVDSFQLYEHDRGTGWQPTREIPLTGAAVARA